MKVYVSYVADGDINGFIDEVSFVNENVIESWKSKLKEKHDTDKVAIISFSHIEPHRKPTGIVRRVDELGRIVIPKEIRKVLKLSPDGGDPMEMFLTDDGGVLLKAYDPDSFGPDGEE